jgi:hypothetical protein
VLTLGSVDYNLAQNQVSSGKECLLPNMQFFYQSHSIFVHICEHKNFLT